MRYTSTRNNDINISGTQAIIKGMSEDGGLFVPRTFPSIDINEFMGLTYQEMAKKLLDLYFPEIGEAKLGEITENYKRKFENSEEITPISSFNEFSFLELYHGPTLSFKDMALTLLPGLMRAAYDVNDRIENILILTATSGDTGSAALEGFKSHDRVEIGVFYPDGGVSEIQKLQMELADGGNAHVFSIKGNFDDAQRSVKKMFGDEEIRKLCQEKSKNLASANSINIARLISQISFYIYSYIELIKRGHIVKGQWIDIIVPTGNFGDILAGIYAKFMGLPIGNTICASNSNDVLTEFFATGVYDANREFLRTLSPSMDILISSNLERFLYVISGNDDEKISEIYMDLKNIGKFEFKGDLPKFIKGVSIDDEETKNIINELFVKYSYLIDPHTAVAFGGLKLTENYPLIVSTASPFKFPEVVLEALGGESPKELKDKINLISELTNTKVPKVIEKMLINKVEDKKPLEVEQMKVKVMEILER